MEAGALSRGASHAIQSSSYSAAENVSRAPRSASAMLSEPFTTAAPRAHRSARVRQVHAELRGRRHDQGEV